MNDIASLVPGFSSAMDSLPGMPTAYGKLLRSLDHGSVSGRLRAQIHLVVAGFIHCDYCQWVAGRMAEREGLSGEDILFATVATARDSQEAAILRLALRIVSGGITEERIRLDEMEARLFADVELAEIAAHVALAVLTCSVLQSIAPGRTAARREA